jgi:hypothetical protein
LHRFTLCLISLAVVSGSFPTRLGIIVKAQDACAVPSDWLPTTPTPATDTPAPHPAPECPFYRAAWENFLYATQPDSGALPRFLSSSYFTVADLFGASAVPQFARPQSGLLSLAPRNIQSPNETILINAGVNQAGPLRGLLIDQNGNPIYYAIHVNKVYADFVRQNGLTTKDALLNADPDKLQFPEGAVELKSAWQIVDGDTPPPNYLTTSALVPNLKISNGDVVIDTTSRKVMVSLLAIHVVFVLKGHPEFIWSTFEHLGANGQGLRDNAPAALANPGKTPGSSIISTSSWTLFKAGTTADGANQPNSSQDRINSFDEKSQKFKKNGAVLQTSVYRMFPASKSDPNQDATTEDDEVSAVNDSMRQLFVNSAQDKNDKRRNYQLVGAIWLDRPDRDFKSNVLFQNQDGQGTDADGAMVAGEDRLSGTAMESFTQSDQSVAGRPNCFSCHNTKRVTDDVTGKQIIPAKRLNVSHVLSKFLSQQK